MSDAYGKLAKWYDRIFEPMNSGLRGLGMKVYPPQPGMRVLDIGCGTGSHLKLYHDAGCQVSGIDLSGAMLEVARQKLGPESDLRLADATSLPYKDEEFDIIIMSTVIHEMHEIVRHAVINESKRVLKADGRLLWIDFHTGPYKPLKGWLQKMVILIAEISAGREHFRNYRDFIAKKGLAALVAYHKLNVVVQRNVGGNTMSVCLLSKN